MCAKFSRLQLVFQYTRYIFNQHLGLYTVSIWLEYLDLVSRQILKLKDLGQKVLIGTSLVFDTLYTVFLSLRVDKVLKTPIRLEFLLTFLHFVFFLLLLMRMVPNLWITVYPPWKTALIQNYSLLHSGWSLCRPLWLIGFSGLWVLSFRPLLVDHWEYGLHRMCPSVPLCVSIMLFHMAKCGLHTASGGRW